MRNYETMFIINPNLDEEATKAVIEKFSNLLKEQGVEIESIDEWGIRRLAYEINKLKEGYYVVINFKLSRKLLPSWNVYLELAAKFSGISWSARRIKRVRGAPLLNRVVLIGRLTRDPELRYTEWYAVAAFTLAVTAVYKPAGRKGHRLYSLLAQTCGNMCR